jgi:hypothetical protein
MNISCLFRLAILLLKQKHQRTYANFNLVSDMDKELEQAMAECFLDNHSTYFAIHIQWNDWTKFGQKPATSVVSFACIFCYEEDDVIEVEVMTSCDVIKVMTSAPENMTEIFR